MNGSAYATELETLFMALADKTRLRLLNLMSDGEVCVGLFTDVLGDSQPKVSRHLAYLRSAGLVNARRDGKWMHYSIQWPTDDGMFRIVKRTIEAMEKHPEMQFDRIRYAEICSDQASLDQVARTPMVVISAQPNISHRRDAHNELEEFLL
jgi:ArsR family transcriptional regulator